MKEKILNGALNGLYFVLLMLCIVPFIITCLVVGTWGWLRSFRIIEFFKTPEYEIRY